MKKIRVIKVGGSCLSKASDLEQVVHILDGGLDYVLVVSAFKNVTNLIERWFDSEDYKALAELKSIHEDVFTRLFPEKDFYRDFPLFAVVENLHKVSCTRDWAVTLGENMSSFIVEMYLQKKDVDISILEKDPYLFGNTESYDFVKSKKMIKEAYQKKGTRHVLTQGYASWNSENQRDNLGREGSDLTAVVWASALDVECILYKDVGSLYSEDPKKNPEAESISKISFQEYGARFYSAGIVYDKVIDFCITSKRDLFIYDFYKNQLGTKIYS